MGTIRTCASCQSRFHFLGTVILLAIAQRLFAQAVYVPNFITSNVSGYVVDPATGALSAIPGLPIKSGTSPVHAIIHPGGRFLYVADAGANDISLYSISAPSGTLSQLPCLRCDASSPAAMAIDPAGSFLFVTNRNPGTVTPYIIDKTSGGLTKLPATSTGINSNPVHAMVDPTGTYLYVADANGGRVVGFSISGGSLTPVPGSPFAAGSGPASVAVSRNAVFVANQFSGDVSTYRIAAGGTLLPDIQATPVGGSPTSVAVDPTGTYVYVANQSQVIALNTSPNGPFALTYLRAYNGGTVPSFVAVDPRGNYAYVVNTISDDVSGFAIAASGTLIPAGSASIAGVSGPGMLAVGHIGDPTTISLSGGFPSPPSGSVFGSTMTFSGLVRDAINPATAPTGSISVQLNAKPLPGATGALTSAGTFQIVFNSSTQYIPVGTNILQFSYSPGTGFEAPSPLRLTYTVLPATPVISVSTSADPAAGHVVNITASLQQTGGKFPSGSMRFLLDGAQAAGPVQINNGFAASSIVPSAGSHVLSAVYSGDDSFTAGSSSLLTFTARYVTSIAVTPSASTFTYGLTPLLAVALTSGSSNITGTVDLFDNGVKLNSSPLPVNGGQAIYQSGVMTAGSHQITAQYSGDANNLPSNNLSVPLSITVTRAIPQLGTPQLVGTAADVPMTVSVTVSANGSGTALPTGTVSLLDGGSGLSAAAVVNGTATFSVSQLPAGTHSMSANYGGDSNYGSASSAVLSVAVPKTNPKITLSTTPNSLVVGQQVTVTAAVTGYSPLSGTVEIIDSGVDISGGAIALKDGSAATAFVPAAAGTHSIAAVYSGDSNNNASNSSTSPVLLVVRQAQTSVSLAMSGASIFGQPLTLKASVSVVAPGGGAPTGTMEFRDGAILLATAPLSGGAATGTVTLSSAGDHHLSASYSGDSNFLASASSALSVTEAPAPANANLAVSQSRTGTVLSLSLGSVGSVVPTGNVTFSLDGRLVGTAPLVAQATGALATLRTGVVSGVLTASYPGDGNFQPASPLPVSILPLSKLALSLSVFAVPAAPLADQPFNCDIKLSGISDVAVTGALQVLDGSAVIASTQANPEVLIAISLSAGTHTLIVTYSGDNNYLPASSSLTVTAVRATPTLALSADTTSTVYGQNISLVASLGMPSNINKTMPSGAIQFLDGNSVIASSLATNGIASAVSAALQPGIHQIAAVYSGDSQWQPVRTNVVTVTVMKASTAVTIGLSSPNPVGAAVSVSASLAVTAPGAGNPSGVIDLVDPVTNQTVASGSVTNGAVTISVSTDVSWNNLVAVYRGDTFFQGSSSAPSTGIAIVNAASYQAGALAANEIATVFVGGLIADVLQAPAALASGTLGGMAITLIDGSGRAHEANLFYASPSQISLIMPSDLPPGPATMKLSTSHGQTVTVLVRVSPVAPGLFTANATGQGAAAAQVIRVHSDGTQDAPQNTAVYDPSSGTWSAAPIYPATTGDTIYLVLYATGVRSHSSPVTVEINGTAFPALYAGAQPAFAGLDQVNVQLPVTLQAGELHISLTVDGFVSNAAAVAFAAGDSTSANTLPSASGWHQ